MSTQPETDRDPALPGTLDRDLHSKLKGRDLDPWVRRLALLAMAAIPLAALLGAFGQRPSTENGQTVVGDAQLRVSVPSHLRGGLVFQARIEVEAGSAGIEEPILSFSDGWLESVTLNAITPEPQEQEPWSEGQRSKGALWRYGSLAPGEALTVWTQWQVNPTRVGVADADLELRDGSRTLAVVNRTITYFP